jgi:hypothetical protein
MIYELSVLADWRGGEARAHFWYIVQEGISSALSCEEIYHQLCALQRVGTIYIIFNKEIFLRFYPRFQNKWRKRV